MSVIAPKNPRRIDFDVPQAPSPRAQVSARKTKSPSRFAATPDSYGDAAAEEPSAHRAVSKQHRAGRRELEASRKQQRELREDHDTDDL